MSITNINHGSSATQASVKISTSEVPTTKKAQHQTITLPGDPSRTPERSQSPPAPENTTAKELRTLTEADMREVTQKVQTAIDKASKDPQNVEFRHDDRSGGFIIEIRSPSGELIRQFPQEKVLNMRDRLDDLSGMIIDEMI